MSYYEYKYLVPNQMLPIVKEQLNCFLAGTDPYPTGLVRSLYFDSIDGKSFKDCQSGNASKLKFRLRGYNTQPYEQFQIKFKDQSKVRKIKSNIERVDHGLEVKFDDLSFINPHDRFVADSYAVGYSFLKPVIKIVYNRNRYSCYNQRITLDYNIKFSSFGNESTYLSSEKNLSLSVLEIKTKRTDPVLPFFGSLRLQQVSFSKFLLGILSLRGDNSFLLKYV